MNCIKIDLLQGDTDTLFRQAPFLYDFRQFSHSFLRVGQEVDPSWCFAKALLNCSINTVVLVIDIVEFYDGDAVLVLVLFELVKVFKQRIAQEKQFVFVCDTL
jgi:hypothetical protein